MSDVYLFDWGDTLMVDFPGVPGKMCDWAVVQAVDGAEEALEALSSRADVYVATGAADSTEPDIAAAFARVGLDRYVSGYFCRANLGIGKGSPAFFAEILKRLGKPPSRVTMVGDSLQNDIEPARAVGFRTVWHSNFDEGEQDDPHRVISSLRRLRTQQRH